VEEVPSLVQMQERMKAKGITVLAVSVDVDDSNYRRFVRDHSVNLLTCGMPTRRAMPLYGTFKVSRNLCDRPQRRGAAQVYWGGGLDGAGCD